MVRRLLRRRTVTLTVAMAAAVAASAWIGLAVAGDAPLMPSDRELEAAREAGEHLGKLSDSFRAVARVVEPSVVFISVQSRGGDEFPLSRRDRRFGPGDDPREFFREFFEDRWGERPGREQPEEEGEEGEERQPQYNAPRQIGAGSGWVWDKQGHIITNHHVVSRADRLEVVFADGSTAEAVVVGSDPKTDVAVIRVDRDGLYPARRAEREVDQGDLVFAFGSPFQYRFSMSQGIVSGTDRAVGILGPEGYENFIQTDAAINPGNSGGPLTNVRGEVVGMNTAIATRSGAFSGIGFAVPIDVIEPVVRQLISTGEVVRGYIGALIGDDPALVESFGVDDGVVLHDVVANGPADRAGLKAGDVVTRINGEAVGSSRELRRVVAGFRPDEKVTFHVVRDGKRRQIEVTIGRQPESMVSSMPGAEPEVRKPEQSESLRQLGIEELRTFDGNDARRKGWDHEPGVLVTQVRRGSVAEASGLRPGMVITHVMGQRIRTADELSEAIAEVDATKGVRFRVRIEDDRSTYVFMRLIKP